MTLDEEGFMNRLTKVWLDKRGLDLDKIDKLNDACHQPLLDVDVLCDELLSVFQHGDEITILPDYDCDGIMAGTLGYAGFSELGFKVNLFRPDPARGYGFDEAEIDRLLREFPATKAVITCDTGITCFAGVSAARTRGLKVFVTDHHMPAACGLPDADIVVDPCRADDSYEHKQICGAYVLWQVLFAYAQRNCDVVAVEQIRRLRVFAGIGTVSDMMTLIGENRKLVRDAISICQLCLRSGDGSFVANVCATAHSAQYARAFVGLHALLSRLQEGGKLQDSASINEETFGFYIAPMLNSVKRMGANISLAFDLFLGNNNDKPDYANALFALNEQRKANVACAFDDMMSADQPFAPHVLVSDAAPGMLGLLAARALRDVIGPVLVVHRATDGSFSGSGRSPAWYPAVQKLARERKFIVRGHEGAFGVSVKDVAELASLAAAITADVDAVLKTGAVVTDTRAADVVMSQTGDAADCGIEIPLLRGFVRESKSFAPFGRGFQAPVVAFDMAPASAEWNCMGKESQHVKGVFEHGLEVLWWNSADKLDGLRTQDNVRCFGHLGVNEWQDRSTLNFYIDEVEKG